MGQPCFEDKLQELNTDFAQICISPKPSGAPVGKVPLQVLKELEHEARQNLSTINFTATFARTASSCNTVMEKCQHSIKAAFKRVKSQIQKGADPERAVILQRELYTLGNTGLPRREAEMTLLQPHLGDSRCQELRNSPFWPSALFKSQLVKDGEDFLLKKAPLKTLRVLDPTKTSPFVVHTTIKKEAPTGNAPVGAIPLKAVTNQIPQVEGNQTQEASGAIFDPTQGDEGVETSSQ